ncbi:Ras guanine nucleotide exchange factor [Entamoeba marina]
MSCAHLSHSIAFVSNKLYPTTSRNNSNKIDPNHYTSVLLSHVSAPKSFMSSQRLQINIQRQLECNRHLDFNRFVLKPTKEGNSVMTLIEEVKEDKLLNVLHSNNKTFFSPNQCDEDTLRQYFQMAVVRENMEVLSGCLDSLLNCLCLEDTDIMHAFVWTHSSFTTSTQVLTLLRDRFEKCCSNDSSLSQAVKARIVNALKYWIDNTWQMNVEKDSPIVAQMISFLKLLRQYGMKKQRSLLKDVMDRVLSGRSITMIQCINKKYPPIIPSIHSVFEVKRPIKFLDFPPLEFAQQITLFSSSLFSKIKLIELLKSTSNSTKNECLNIAAMTNFSNSFQAYFSSLLLHETNIKRRALIVERLYLLAIHCIELNNYDTAVCIVTLFSTSAIHRLKRTLLLVSPKVNEQYQRVKEIINMEKNWATLRAAVDQCNEQCIPYLGIILSDLIFTTDGNKTINEDSTINFTKCRMLSDLVIKVHRMQQLSYESRFLPSEEYQQFIKQSIQSFDKTGNDVSTDESRFKLSKQLEVSDIITKEVFCQADIPDNRLVFSFISPFSNTIKRYLPSKTNVTLARIINDINGSEIDFEGKKIYFFFFENQPNCSFLSSTILDDIFFEHSFNTISFSMVVSSLKYVNCVFEFNGSLVNSQLPLDYNIPLIQQYPIINTYLLRCFPFIPLKINQDYKIDGFMCTMNSLESYNWKTDDILYLYETASLPLNFSNLDIDEKKFSSFKNFKKISVKLHEKGSTSKGIYTLMVVDQFFIIYKKSVFMNCLPIDFCRVSYVNSPPKSLIQLQYLYPFELSQKQVSIGTNSVTRDDPLQLSFVADSEIIQDFLLHLHVTHPKFNKNQVFGLNPEFIPQNKTYHVPKVFMRIVKALYFNPDFFNEDFFDCVKVERALGIAGKIEDGEYVNIHELPSTTLVGLYYLYLDLLNMPLLPLTEINKIQKFTMLDSKEQNDLILNLLENTAPEVKGIFQIYLQLFYVWALPNPSKLTKILHYSHFLFLDFCSTENSQEIFKHLISNCSQLPRKSVPHISFSEMIPNYTLTPIMDEIVIQKYSENIKQSVNTPNVVNAVLSKKNSRLDIVKTPQRKPFKKVDTSTLSHKSIKAFAIGKKRHDTSTKAPNLSELTQSSPNLINESTSVGDKSSTSQQSTESKLSLSENNKSESSTQDEIISPSTMPEIKELNLSTSPRLESAELVDNESSSSSSPTRLYSPQSSPKSSGRSSKSKTFVSALPRIDNTNEKSENETSPKDGVVVSPRGIRKTDFLIRSAQRKEFLREKRRTQSPQKLTNSEDGTQQPSIKITSKSFTQSERKDRAISVYTKLETSDSDDYVVNKREIKKCLTPRNDSYSQLSQDSADIQESYIFNLNSKQSIPKSTSSDGQTTKHSIVVNRATKQTPPKQEIKQIDKVNSLPKKEEPKKEEIKKEEPKKEEPKKEEPKKEEPKKEEPKKEEVKKEEPKKEEPKKEEPKKEVPKKEEVKKEEPKKEDVPKQENKPTKSSFQSKIDMFLQASQEAEPQRIVAPLKPKPRPLQRRSVHPKIVKENETTPTA